MGGALSWSATAAIKGLTHDIFGKPMTAREKLVLFVIADYYNPEYSCAWAGLASIARESLTSRRHLLRVITQLEKKGMLDVEHRDQDTNIYRFPCMGATSIPRDTMSPPRDIAMSPPRDIAMSPPPRDIAMSP